MFGVCLRVFLCVCGTLVKCQGNALNTSFDKFQFDKAVKFINSSQNYIPDEDYFDEISDYSDMNGTRRFILKDSVDPNDIIELNDVMPHLIQKRQYGTSVVPYDNKQLNGRYNYYVAQPGNKVSEWHKRLNGDRYSYVNPINTTKQVLTKYRGPLTDPKFNEQNNLKLNIPIQDIAVVTIDKAHPIVTTKVYDYMEQENDASKEKDFNRSLNENSDVSDYEEQVLMERESKELVDEPKYKPRTNSRQFIIVPNKRTNRRDSRKREHDTHHEDDEMTASAIKRRMTVNHKKSEDGDLNSEAYHNYLKRSKTDTTESQTDFSSNESQRYHPEVTVPLSEAVKKSEGSHHKYIVKENMYWKNPSKPKPNGNVNKPVKSKDMLHPQISLSQLQNVNDKNLHNLEAKIRKAYLDAEFVPQYPRNKVDRTTTDISGNLFTNKISSLFFGTAAIPKPVVKSEPKADKRDFFAGDATVVHYSKANKPKNHYSYPWYAITNKFGVKLVDGKTHTKPRIPMETTNKKMYDNIQTTIKKTHDLYEKRRFNEETMKPTTQRILPRTLAYNLTKDTKEEKQESEELNYHTAKNTYNALLSRNSARKFTRKTLTDIEGAIIKNVTDFNDVFGLPSNDSIDKSRYFKYPSKAEPFHRNQTNDKKTKSGLKRQFPKHLPIFRTKTNKTKKQKHPCYMEQLNSITFTNRVLRKPVPKCDTDNEDGEKNDEVDPTAETHKHILKRDETCQTADGETGTCVNLYNCIPAMKEGMQDTELMKLVYCGFDGIVPMVCCTNVNKKSTSILKVMSRPEPATKKRYTDESSYALKPPFCGGSTKVKKGNNRFTGFPAEPGNFPWMALLGYRTKYDRLKWMCSGTLVSAQHVLTSAFCVRSDLYTVRLGDLDTSRADDTMSPLNVSIQQKIRHGEYNSQTSENDIGLLVLSRQIQFTKLISPVCLPLLPTSQDLSFEKFLPTLVGWMHAANNKPTSRLTAAQLPVVSAAACARAYRRRNVTVSSGALCAGYRKTNCLADPGAALVQMFWNEGFPEPFYYQIGILSGPLNCENPQLPALFTRLTHYLPWIEKHISQTHLL